MFAQVSRWIVGKWKMRKRGYRIGSKLNIAATIVMARVYRLSLIKHRSVDIYAAIFTPGSDPARDKPATGWLIQQSKAKYRSTRTFLSFFFRIRRERARVEFVQKGKVPRFLPFRFLNDPPCRNENRGDNLIEIGLEKTGLDCLAGQRAVFWRRSNVYIPSYGGNGWNFSIQLAHIRCFDDACSITILMNGLPRRIAI